jgi:8-oxo-dGTP pyrophosphatase MutT (NUDIX family)
MMAGGPQVAVFAPARAGGGTALERVAFGDCLLERVLGSDCAAGEAVVALRYVRDELRLELRRPDSDLEGVGERGALVPLAHKTPACPARDFELAHAAQAAALSRAATSGKLLLRPVGDRVLRVGVAVLVESGDGRLLLTRRQPRLRSFPGLYVLPGGHLEAGETLVQAGIRELLEETGLRLVDEAAEERQILSHKARVRLHCLWESTFPLSLEPARPGRDEGLTHHHLVVYIHAYAPTLLSSDASALRPQASEVSELAWVSKLQARRIGFGPGPDSALPAEERRVSRFIVPADAFDADDWERQVAVLHEPAGAAALDVEELAGKTVIGTRFALRTLLNRAGAGVAGAGASRV